jgi:ferredoxin--NADP+ reductase
VWEGASVTYRAAVVGAGPSGLYAADALASAGAQVDVIERLPVPFGLVRYGVAPDHFSIRSVRDTLAKVLARPEVRLLAGVEVGSDVSVAELLAAYDAVVLTYGASRDRHLDVPGEDLPGSVAATDLVNWYCGHPDADRETIEAALRAATSVVVVGVGNVAVDVARVLVAPASRLDATDMPQHVLDVVESTGITEVHILGRRTAAHANWTTKELRELGELDGVDVVCQPVELVSEPVADRLDEEDRVVHRNLEVLHEWSQREPTGAPKRIHLHFHARPHELRGDGRVETLVVERTRVDDDGSAHGTGETWELPAQLVVRSVGYRGLPLEDVPFDSRRNVVRNDEGRVVDESGAQVPGLYVAGWIKRGPSGIIGTNKKDAAATVAHLLEDLDGAEPKGGDGIVPLLAERGVVPVGLEGWHAVDAAERALGGSRGRDRTTIHERDALLDAARSV